MPGRLAMDDTNDSLGSIDQKNNRVNGADTRGQDADGGFGIPGLGPTFTNGAVGSSAGSSAKMANGTNGASQNTPVLMNGVAEGKPDSSDLTPPELEHFTESYVPFGKLLGRIAQQAYFDLNETLDGMADIAVSAPPAAVNGVDSASHNHPDPSSASVDKKLRLMNFAQTQKDRFVKALVLSEWARNMDSTNRLIELTMWLRRQDEMCNAAADGMLRLKHNMIGAKMPNPNIDGAFEILSTGRADWMPDLGYIPPKPLTVPQSLDTLKRLDFTLSVRLSLHEELPPLFHDYSIANGRATFIVPGEFEVDLAAADEDPDTPFYFIDIRLLFTPSSSILTDRLRNEMEGRVNDVLSTKGLKGCYDFLHTFVLTHKLNVLRCQAVDLAKHRWRHCIQVSAVHRSVIVQYWTPLIGGKNWIELGVVSGNDRKRLRERTSRIHCRWFRRGQEVTEHDLEFDYHHLSMEDMLDRVIARHVSGRLTSINDQLSVMASNSKAFSHHLSASNSDPAACELALRVEQLPVPYVVRVEPVSGSLYISPPSKLASETQDRIAEDPALAPAQALQYTLCKALQEHVTKRVLMMGWTQVRLDRQANIDSIFAGQQSRYLVFKQQQWGDRFAIAITISLQGLIWWIAELRPIKEVYVISNATPLQTEQHVSSTGSLDRSTLARLGKSATSEIQRLALSLEAQKAGIRTSFGLGDGDGSAQVPKAKSMGWSMFIEARDIFQPRSLHAPRDAGQRLWQSGIFKLSYTGHKRDEPQSKRIIMVIRAALSSHKVENLLQSIDSGYTTTEAVMKQSQCVFEMRIEKSLGEALLPELLSRLQRAERLYDFVRIARRHHFVAEIRGLRSLIIRYSSEPSLFAHIRIAEAVDETSRTSLRLYSSRKKQKKNPHLFIQHQLEKFLTPLPSFDDVIGQKRMSAAFNTFCKLLAFTLPALTTLLELCAAHTNTFPTMQTLAAASYRLTYSTKDLFRHVFLIQAKSHAGRFWWSVSSSGEAPDTQGAYTARLRERIWNSKGRQWTGLGRSATASAGGIQDLLKRINETVVAYQLEASQQNETKEDGAEGSADHEVVVLD